MANLRGLIKKLQTAIAKQGYIIKINTYQFYSDGQKRFITGYLLVSNDKELLKTCSQVEVLQFLSELYEKVKGEADDGKAKEIR